MGEARSNDNLLNVPLNVRINHWLLPTKDSLWEQAGRREKASQCSHFLGIRRSRGWEESGAAA